MRKAEKLRKLAERRGFLGMELKKTRKSIQQLNDEIAKAESDWERLDNMSEEEAEGFTLREFSVPSYQGSQSSQGKQSQNFFIGFLVGLVVAGFSASGLCRTNSQDDFYRIYPNERRFP